MKVTERDPLPDMILGSRPGDALTNGITKADCNNVEERRKHAKAYFLNLSTFSNVWPELGPVSIDYVRVKAAANKIYR